MAKTNHLIEDFDQASLDMWNSIGTDAEYVDKFNEIAGKPSLKPKLPRINREELLKLRDNSLVCVETAKKEMDKLVKEEKYFKANEMRIAGIIHKNFAERLNNILNGLPAF